MMWQLIYKRGDSEDAVEAKAFIPAHAEMTEQIAPLAATEH
jgi:hypothetical protein